MCGLPEPGSALHPFRWEDSTFSQPRTEEDPFTHLPRQREGARVLVGTNDGLVVTMLHQGLAQGRLSECAGWRDGWKEGTSHPIISYNFV